MLRTTIKIANFRSFSLFPSLSSKYFGALPESPIDASTTVDSLIPKIQNKIEKLEQNQPFFDRLVFFDPDIMASLPEPLQMFDPIVETTKDFILNIHNFTGLPWWIIFAIICGMVRITIMPLIYLQMKRTAKVVSIAPVLIACKKLYDNSKLPRYRKLSLFAKSSMQTIRNQNLKFLRLTLYNLINVPIIINMVWGIRRVLVEDSVKNTGFLWISSLSAIDPYYIIPFLTVACYYYNFGRFITKENQHTLIARVKNACQILMILWLPWLCNWPSGIVLYMFYNALFSVFQSTLLTSQRFNRKVNPKLVLYQFLVRSVEYNKAQSDALIEAIKTGEESFKEKAISEEELVEQMKESLKLLEKEKNDEFFKNN